MQDDTDASGEKTDMQHTDDETSSEQSGVSRRTVLKGMYAAPAIMAVGSLPSFASGTSPVGDDGDEDHHTGDDWDDDHDNEKDWKDGWWGWHWWWW